MQNIAVIGAGMSGITCAEYLCSRGFKVSVFEKSRGLGGRLATRRINNDLSVDHGVQYISAKSSAFKKYLKECISLGYAEYWEPSGMDAQYLNQNKIVVGTPGMNSILKFKSKNLDIKFSCKVKKVIKKNSKQWAIDFENVKFQNSFDLVVFAIPPDQVKELIAEEKSIVEEMSFVELDPCWTLILNTKKKLGCYDFNRFQGGKIASIVNNTSKPNRNKLYNSYVIHASSEWTKENLFLERAAIELNIVKLLEDKLNENIEIEYLKAHRWLYAQTKVPLGKAFSKNKDNTLFICGDWCLGANVESAFSSGLTLAEFVESNFRHK